MNLTSVSKQHLSTIEEIYMNTFSIIAGTAVLGISLLPIQRAAAGATCVHGAIEGAVSAINRPAFTDFVAARTTPPTQAAIIKLAAK